MILLYVAITFYGSFVLTGVVEEKSSRVVEVLLSRVPPSSLLGGKIAGIGLAGLAQFLAVAAAAAGTLLATRPSGLPPGTYAAIPMLVVWFVLGYAFYAMLYGSLGSLASRTEDAQAAAGPVIIHRVGTCPGARRRLPAGQAACPPRLRGALPNRAVLSIKAALLRGARRAAGINPGSVSPHGHSRVAHPAVAPGSALGMPAAARLARSAQLTRHAD
jgi:hypothetical protein